MSTLSICTIFQDEADSEGTPIKWYLETCAYLAEHIPGLKEVVLVDGGSKDRSREVIESYRHRMPLVLLDREYDNTRNQQNFGLEHVTGDFIFGLDADMSVTKNFVDAFKSGIFESASYWDFPMMFLLERGGKIFLPSWPRGVNMRLWKRGPKWKQERQFHVQLEGQTQGIPVCGGVIIFENSCRIKDDEALMHRGERRQKYIEGMHAEGASPGPPDRFYGAAHMPDSGLTLLPQSVLDIMIPGTI